MAEGYSPSNIKVEESDVISKHSDSKEGRLCEVDGSDTYEVAGGKLSFHGVVYQRKLLMLFALRSIDKRKKFKLATEMKQADKIDDAILIYPKVDGTGNYYRFLQAKHRSGEAKEMRRISAYDLLKETDGDFSIPTYFRSYLKIVHNDEFLGKGDEIYDLIICSNAPLWIGNTYEDFVLTNNIFENIDEEDFIFGKTLLKLKQVFPGRKKIVSLLLNSFSKFPNNFAKSIKIDKSYDHSQTVNDKKNVLEVESLYEIVFLEEVVHLKSKIFREDFVTGVNLSGIGKHFRDSLFSEWQALNCEGDFKNWLKTKVIDVIGISDDLGLAEKLSESVRKNLTKKVIEIHNKKSLIYKNMDKLKTLDVLEVSEGRLRFSQRFLQSVGLCETAQNIRKEFIKKLSYFKIELKSLEVIQFEFNENPIQSKSITINEFNPELYVEQYLSILVFALDQPNERDLGIMIKDELISFLAGITVDTAYSKMYTWMDEWLSSPKGRFLTEKDFKSFFDDLKEEVIFDLRDPVSNFTGRVMELNELHEMLFEVENQTAVISQYASISGFGGIGKSEIVRMFAKKHRNKFNNIIWIDCEEMASSFRRLAFDRLRICRENANGEEKKIESIVEEVYQRLRGKKNLFVFDNAEQLRGVGEGSNGIDKFRAPSSEGNLNYYLITSRKQKWGNIKVLSIDKFTDDEAIEFFRLSFGSEFDETLYDDYKKLAEVLGNFPLAMQHAVAYIKETSEQLKLFHKNFTVTDYLIKFQEKSKELLQHEFSEDCDDHYTRTTYTTMTLALESISLKENGSFAIRIMNCLSYLCPDKIQPKFLSIIFDKGNDDDIAKAILMLQKYSMISLMNNGIIVHRLLQLVDRIILKEKGLEKEILTSIFRVHESLNLENKMSLWSHVESNVDLLENFSVFPFLLILELMKTNETESAINFAKKVEVALRNNLGYYHMTTIYIRLQIFTLSMTFEYIEDAKEGFDKLRRFNRQGLDPSSDRQNEFQGNFYRTFVFYVKTFEELREFYGDSHPCTLPIKKFIISVLNGEIRDLKKSFPVFGAVIVENNFTYAICLLKDQKFSEALKALQDVTGDVSLSNSLPVRERVEILISVIKIQLNLEYGKSCEFFERQLNEFLGKGDLDNLYNDLFILKGIDLSLFGEVIIKTYRQHYERFKNIYGEEQRLLTEWRALYGRALSSVGFVDEGIKELSESYVIQQRLMNENCPTIMLTRNWIASSYCDKGDHRKALSLHEENLAINGSFSDLLYLNHLDSKTGMVLEYSHLGEYKIAVEMINEILNERDLDVNEKNYGIYLIFMEIFQKDGDYKMAVFEFSKIYKKLIEWFGKNSFSTLEVGLKYSKALYDHGSSVNRTKSYQIFDEILCQLKEMGIKGELIQELPIIELIAEVLNRFKMYEEEKIYLSNVLKTLDKYLGRNKPRTMLIMCKLTLVECNLGNILNSRELLKDIESYQPCEQNGDHVYTEIKMKVAEIYSKLKDFDKCLEIMKQVQKIQEETSNVNQLFMSDIVFKIALAMSQDGESLKILKSNRNSLLGFDFRDILNARRKIIADMFVRKRHKEARKLCRELLKVQCRNFGKSDIDSVRTYILLILDSGYRGKYMEAFLSLAFCINVMSEQIGKDNVEILELKKHMERLFVHSSNKFLERLYLKVHRIFLNCVFTLTYNVLNDFFYQP